MKGTYLKFYVLEKRRHDRILLYDWLLQRAKALGIHGGSAFRSIAGFGRDGTLHQEHFFELAGDLMIEVVFAISDEEADRLLQVIRSEHIQVFYIRMPVEYGMVQDSQPSL